jgi:hypothetical protein
MFRAAIAALVLVLLTRSPVLLVALGWFLGPYEEVAGAGVLSHRVHEISFGILFSWALVGALTQWRKPERHLAGLYQLVLAITVFTVMASAVTGRFEWFSLMLTAPVVVACLTHPTGGGLIVPPWRPWPVGIGLALIVLPLVTSRVVHELGLAASRAQGHATHWAGMAAFLAVLGLVAVVAALRPPGYRVTAASVGVGATIYGLAVAFYPFDASSHRGGWLLVAWGLAWVGAAAAPTRERIARPVLRIVLFATAPLLAILAGLAALVLVEWSAPRVPHNLEAVPGMGTVAWPEADRATCLTCHAGGVQGAPVVDHPAGACDPSTESCIAGRVDCLGCHQFDPRLGGPVVPVVDKPVISISQIPVAGEPLDRASLLRIERHLEGRDP